MTCHIDVIEQDLTGIDNALYIDKTDIIALLNAKIATSSKYVCISRPRRFGKSLTASMLCSYYSKRLDSKALFSKFKIAKDPSFTTHLNKYHTIALDIHLELFNAQNNVDQMISMITDDIADDIRQLFPSVTLKHPNNLQECLNAVYQDTHESFVFVIDEWDDVLKNEEVGQQGIEKYLQWLNSILNGQSYVALAYMTGVLPVRERKGTCLLNIFDNFTMLKPSLFAPFIGFTEHEAKELCKQYHVDFTKITDNYGGYLFDGNEHIYNPHSSVQAITRKSFLT